MIKILKDNWIFILVVFIASVLRLYKLGDFPVSLTWDETALGYNAYSIAQTGHDEYNKLLPIIFKSFGDFKPGLYVYLTVPFVVLLGLTELAVRLPSSLLGILTVVTLYFYLRESFPKTKVCLFGSLALAINPWHIRFSRGAWEANVAVFMCLAGVYFFQKIKQNNFFLLISSLMFGLTFITYQGAKVFTPLFLLGILLFHKSVLARVPGRTKLFSILLLIVPLLYVSGGFISGAESGRAKVMSVFSYPRQEKAITALLTQDNTQNKNLNYYLFHSEEFNFVRGIANRYFNHLSGKFLVFEGDWSNKRMGVPYMGVIYYIDIFFLVVGIYWIIRNNYYFILYWLLISPIPAAITRDIVSSVRSLNMAIPLCIVIGIGLWATMKTLRGKGVFSSLGYLIVFLFYFMNISYFIDQYYVHAPIHNSNTSQYGYKEVISEIKSNIDKYDKIIFTQSYGQPYIYWLFYTKLDPRLYQKENHMVNNFYGDVGSVEKFGKIEFRNIYWPQDRGSTNSLFIGNEFDLPEKDVKETQNATLIKDVRFLDGKLAFRIVSTQ